MGRRVKFGEVVEQKTATVDPLEESIERYVAIEHLDPLTYSVERWGAVSEGTTFNRRFSPGDVLFSKRRAYQRKAARVSFEGVCSGDLLVFSAKPDGLRPGLLPFIVQSEEFFEHAVRTSAGSLSPRTRWKDLAEFEFTLPDLETQIRLEAELGQGEVARLAWNAVVARGEVLRRVLGRRAMTDESWRRVPLGEVAVIRNGSTPRRNKAEYWVDGDIPWLPTGKVHEREIRSADEFITTKALDECPLRIVPAGSVLVAMIGQGKTRGSVAYLHIDAAINQNFAAVIPDGELDPRFLFHILDSSYGALRHVSQGSSQGALNCRLISEFEVPLPSLRMQGKVAEKFEAVAHAIRGAIRQSEATLALQQALTNTNLMAPDVH